MGDIGAVTKRLRDPMLATRLIAMQELLDVVRGIGREFVTVLARETEDPLLVAEQIWWISATVQPELKSLLDSASTIGARLSAALLLLNLDNKAGLPLLLESVRGSDRVFVAPIVTVLARKAPKEAGPVIVERISREADAKNVMALVGALETIGIPIPDPVRERWTSPDAPWEVRKFIEIGDLRQ